MAKYNFNDSRYAKFFSSPENVRFLQTYLDRTDLFYTNYGWYKTQVALHPPRPLLATTAVRCSWSSRAN